MGIKDWKKEFYSPISKVAKKDAVAHSLKKWKGLTKANLEKHGLTTFCGDIVNLESPDVKLAIGADSCSLCRHYYHHSYHNRGCGECPVIKYKRHRGGVETCTCSPEFDVWTNDENPEPMIQLLEKTLEFTRK